MDGLTSTAVFNTSHTDRPTNHCLHNDSFKYHAYTVTYMVVFPVAFLSNMVAMVVFLRQQHNRLNACRVVMMNLAISDWSFSLTLPLRLAYYFQGTRWNFPDWLCRLCTFGFYVNLYSSILFLTLLSVLRWAAVAKPLKHRSNVKPGWVSLVCLAIWLFVGLTSIPFLSEGVVQRDGVPRCFEPSNNSSWCRISILNYLGLVFGFLLPFLTIVTCYVVIIRHVTSPGFPQRSNRARSSSQKTVTLVSMVIVTFLFCFLPYHLVRTLHLHSMCSDWSCAVKVPLQRAVSITLCMAASNSVVNPLLYYYSTKTFRASARTLSSSFVSTVGESFRRESIRGGSIRRGSIRRESIRVESIRRESISKKLIRHKHSEDSNTA
ncbi:Cysteinyl leukotriene receptor 2 [Oryzias melastigma]|uniref:Cysteinyl leukotriene receptor 2 n=1 Tax=Oryzias melastigma TaxID=30732 RepID=A0A834CQY4_ORYME|nr:Cysteinyl leukotriene receptor 2 [Oryzias melastigma]